MKCKIEIEMDNAAFEDYGHAQELRNILEKLILKLEMSEIEPGLFFSAFDTNGNRVGKLEISGRKLKLS